MDWAASTRSSSNRFWAKLDGPVVDSKQSLWFELQEGGEKHWRIFRCFNGEMSCRRRKNQIFKWIETVGLPSSDICGAPSHHLQISATLDRKSGFGGGG